MNVFGLIFVLAVANAQQTTVQTLVNDARFSTLVSLVSQAGLVEVLNNGTFTIFAPTNAAFAKIPAANLTALKSNLTALSEVLLYHVTEGRDPSSLATNELLVRMENGQDARVNIYNHNNKITVQGAVGSQFDIDATNGIIHVIDSVMMPPMTDLVGYVAGNPELSTLLSLVQQAKLASALTQDGLTLFAPTNAAFAKLSSQQVADITGDPAKLASVLTYHVVASTQYSAGLYQQETIPTLNTNDNLVVHIANNRVMIDNGMVTKADIGVTNGVVHLVDHVLVPAQDPVFG